MEITITLKTIVRKPSIVMYLTIMINIPQFSLALVLFDPLVLPLRVRVDKGILHSQKLHRYSNFTIRFLVSNPGYSWGGVYSSAEIQSMYSTAPANLAINMYIEYIRVCEYRLYICVCKLNMYVCMYTEYISASTLIRYVFTNPFDVTHGLFLSAV